MTRYLCGHQVCTACGKRQFSAWHTDADPDAMECVRCGEMASGIVGPQWSIAALPGLRAVTVIDDTLAARQHRLASH